MPFAIVDGRVQTRSLEVHVTDHCNLQCRQCCSLSPFLPTHAVEPEQLARDLTLAHRVLAPGIFKLVGGEPLLHPQLLDCLRIARASGIAPIISVTTNGLLLGKMAEEFWEMLDALTLSVYPRPRLSDNLMAYIQSQTQRHDIALNIKNQDQFQHMTLDVPRTDAAETRSIFQTCWLRERCHMLRDGRFYLCTRPVHFDTFYQTHVFSEQDGVPLDDSPDLAEKLRAYLQNEIPLKSCELCLGGAGSLFPHRQLSRLEVLSRREEPA
jgi:GTP 3',8-cyclase